MTTLGRAFKAINDFCMQEYNSPADFSNPHRIGIAYTEYEEIWVTVQVSVDLIGYRIVYEYDCNNPDKLDGKIEVEQYDNLEKLCEALECMDFDSLVSLPDDVEQWGEEIEE